MKFEKLDPPKDENSIFKHWIFTDKVYVSIICTCFNQESYIKDVINGFLAQKTEYRFEIIIHDDCSSDNTHNIALYYQKKYPNIIKVIQPDDNLYSSKGMNYVLNNAVIHANGEYIALCEGDDFWIDKHKLQKQIGELEKNKDINICFTAAYGLDPQKNISKLCDYKKNQIFNFDDVILGGGAFMPTASLMIRKRIFDNLPEWFFTHAPIGDYFIQILASENGAIYICEYSTVYRINSVGSWSVRLKQRKLEKTQKDVLGYRYAFEELITQYDNDSLKKALSFELFKLSREYLLLNNDDEFKDVLVDSVNLCKYVTFNQKFYYIFHKFPSLLRIIISIRRLT